ncbi:MAG: GTP-binding protein [Variibacter sp.]|nr:GTP-binding protein [Variibacter sp.]
MIPVTVLTGFLGSGKTTLLSHLLRQPEFSRTAVIINEFGEIGLDHELVETTDDSFIALTTGCLCCKVRSDLAGTLADMLRRRDDGSVPAFERVVIETSGLADPAPILQTLMTDRELAERLFLRGVVTTVDAVNGLETLEREDISTKQVAVADRLIVTKSDLVGTDDTALRARLQALNAGAKVLAADHGRVDPHLLFDVGPYDASARALDVASWLAGEHPHAHHAHGHDQEIVSYVLVREQPIRAVTLALFLETLAEHCGGALLRLKGIVAIAESPERPAVIHGVQHVFHPPAWLADWPSDDHRSRMVFITRRIPRPWVAALLEALDQEVAEVAGAGRA